MPEFLIDVKPKVETTREPIPVNFPNYSIVIGESHHESGFSMEPEDHEFMELYYILEGSADCFVEKQSVKLEPENIFVVPRHTNHYLRDVENSPLSLYILALDVETLREIEMFSEQLDQLVTLYKRHMKPLTRYNYAAYEIRRMIRQILYEQRLKRFGYISTIQATTISLLVALNRIYMSVPVPNQCGDTNPTQDRIQKVADYISNNFYEQINVENMARMACLSVRQFTNQFKAVYGVTFTQFLRFHRIHYTQKMLAETDQQIAHICFESGFNDLAHFYRVFKEISGMSPRKYRIVTRKKMLEGQPSETE
ncbi:MAG TPA: AraC family transcriptional regulator [Bacteroidetes bacterium]|nr:AraC family transcriptional regulator [Bacteroidota bacterium]